MLEVIDITLSAMKGFALYKEPIYFLKYKNRYYRQVFYNSTSDYGYWELERALNYTSYLNSQGNMQDWNPKNNKLLLFYDTKAPTHWQDKYKYLLFMATKGDEAGKYNKTFDNPILEVTKELIDCSYQISIYNKKRILDNTLFQSYRELRRVIEQHKQHQEWLMEQELMKREWKFRSKSQPDKYYQVKYQKYNKGYRLSCNCPAWIFDHRKDRTCKHTDQVVEMGNEYFKKGEEKC